MSPTKDLLLRVSAKLFADIGYDAVSMRAIARAAGIRPASIYCHYKSKEAILSAIYDYFRQITFRTRPAEDEYLPVLQHGNAEEILSIVNYSAQDEDSAFPIYTFIVRILFSRIYIDDEAREIYRHYIEEKGIEYVSQLLQKGVEIGRLDMTPEEIDTLATLTLAGRVHVANSLVVDPDPNKGRASETQMISLLSRLIRLRSSQ